MAGETSITVIGNLVDDPELRFTPGGDAVANFKIASTPKTFDRKSNEFKDGETLFLRCSVWREMAENVAESLTKGMRVVAQGNLKSRSYETKEGEKRTVIEFDVQEIGPSLRFANAKVNRTQRNGNGGSTEPIPSHHGTQQPPAAQSQPWSNQPPANSGGWGNGAPSNEPAF